jgi:hypothetical protein
MNESMALSSLPGSSTRLNSESSLLADHECNVPAEEEEDCKSEFAGAHRHDIQDLGDDNRDAITLDETSNPEGQHKDQMKPHAYSVVCEASEHPATTNANTPRLWRGNSPYSMPWDIFSIVISICFLGKLLSQKTSAFLEHNGSFQG